MMVDDGPGTDVIKKRDTAAMSVDSASNTRPISTTVSSVGARLESCTASVDNGSSSAA